MFLRKARQKQKARECVCVLCRVSECEVVIKGHTLKCYLRNENINGIIVFKTQKSKRPIIELVQVENVIVAFVVI